MRGSCNIAIRTSRHAEPPSSTSLHLTAHGWLEESNVLANIKWRMTAASAWAASDRAASHSASFHKVKLSEAMKAESQKAECTPEPSAAKFPNLAKARERLCCAKRRSALIRAHKRALSKISKHVHDANHDGGLVRRSCLKARKAVTAVFFCVRFQVSITPPDLVVLENQTARCGTAKRDFLQRVYVALGLWQELEFWIAGLICSTAMPQRKMKEDRTLTLSSCLQANSSS